MYYNRKKLAIILIMMMLGLYLMVYMVVNAPTPAPSYVFLAKITLIGSPIGIWSYIPPLFFFKKGLDLKGDTLWIVGKFKLHKIPLDQISGYEFEDWAEQKMGIALQVGHKQIKIYPKEFIGGFHECCKYLEELGIHENLKIKK